MTTYFVDATGGNDGNTGLSEGQAWQTLAKVSGFAFNAGDTVQFKRGETWTGECTVTVSGSSGNPITYTDYGVHATAPKITNPTPLISTRGFNVSGDWIIIENFLLDDIGRDGVQLQSSSANCIVRDCEMDDCGVGVTVNGSGHLITRNYIHDLHMVVSTVSPVGDDWGATGIKIYGDSCECSYNVLERCIAPSEDYGYDGGAFELSGSINGLLIHHNYAKDCDAFIELFNGTIQNVDVYYNLSVDNNGKFSLVTLDGDFGTTLIDFHVENNTIVDTAASTGARRLLRFNGDLLANTYYFYNNVVYADNFSVVSQDNDVNRDHNCWHFTTTDPWGTFSKGTHGFEHNPDLVDISNDDLHLQRQSPCIDMGDDLSYSIDYDGVSVASRPAIGAFEYVGHRALANSFDGVDDRYTIADSATMTMQDGDWSVGIWVRVIDNGGSLYQYLISNNNLSTNNSFQLYLREESIGSSPDVWAVSVQDGDGTNPGPIFSSSAPGGDDTWRLIIFQRNTGAAAGQEFELWFCEEGQTATKEATASDASFNAINGGTWYIGCRADTDINRFYRGSVAWFFKADYAWTQTEIEAMGDGLPPWTMAKSASKPLDVCLKLHAADATLLDLTGQNNATKVNGPIVAPDEPRVMSPVKRRRMQCQ